jgi:hypothetical protein
MNHSKFNEEQQENLSQQMDRGRRQAMGRILAGGAAVTAAGVLVGQEEKILAALTQSEEQKAANPSNEIKVDAVSGATRQYTNWAKFADLKEKVPTVKICGLEISRMTFGGGPWLGWSHSRDLPFVSELLKAYHTKEKQFATLKMAEACGINTTLLNPRGCPLIREYWDKANGNIQAITYCYGDTPEQLIERIEFSIQHEVSAVLIQGLAADRLMKQGDTKTVMRCLDLIRKNELPAGICAHNISTFKACVEKNIIPEFWMKTFHHHNYWSYAKGLPEHDNVFCPDPDETTAFMQDRPEPWIAFKVLAGGAISPQNGFRWAFENGADVINVGMLDFEIVDDANICTGILKNKLNRKRRWLET